MASSAQVDDCSIIAGSRWRYRTPPGFEESRLIVGAVVRFSGREPVMCCAVTLAPRRLPDGSLDTATIPFLPMTAGALAGTIIDADGSAELPDGFASAFEDWQRDPRGLSAFTVPFEGLLDRLIALQMADIVNGRSF